MAKARMLHKTISNSEQVNNLSIKAQLLFTWLIPHADDEGRMKGNAKYIKATVVPYHEWSVDEIQKLLEEIATQGLINHWKKEEQQYIEFPTWERYQYIAKDRFHKSDLPSYSNTVDTSYTTRIRDGNNMDTELNVSERNKEEVKKSEDNGIADKSLNPSNYSAKNAGEYAALEAWKKLEPDNKAAFYTTYLPAARKGISADTIYRFASEIHQDKTIKNKGSVFQSKVRSIIK